MPYERIAPDRTLLNNLKEPDDPNSVEFEAHQKSLEQQAEEHARSIAARNGKSDTAVAEAEDGEEPAEQELGEQEEEPSSPSISEATLQLARTAGIPRSEALTYPDEDALLADVVRTYEMKLTQLDRESAEAAEEDEPQQELLTNPFADNQDIEPSVGKAMQGFVDKVNAIVGRMTTENKELKLENASVRNSVKQLRAQTVYATYNEWLSQQPDEIKQSLKSKSNEDKLHRTAVTLRKEFPDETIPSLLDMASAAIFRDAVRAGQKKALSDDLRRAGRTGKPMPRPNQRPKALNNDELKEKLRSRDPRERDRAELLLARANAMRIAKDRGLSIDPWESGF